MEDISDAEAISLFLTKTVAKPVLAPPYLSDGSTSCNHQLVGFQVSRTDSFISSLLSISTLNSKRTRKMLQRQVQAKVHI